MSACPYVIAFIPARMVRISENATVGAHDGEKPALHDSWLAVAIAPYHRCHALPLPNALRPLRSPAVLLPAAPPPIHPLLPLRIADDDGASDGNCKEMMTALQMETT
jgi:hypothetical protein